MRSHAVTQAAALMLEVRKLTNSPCDNLGAALSVSLAVCLGQLGAVAVLVHAGLGGGEGRAGRAVNLQNSAILANWSILILTF